MSYTPVIPYSGYAGWSFLNRTLDSQKSAYSSRPQAQRDEQYFREKIGSVTTADELVSDRRLLNVALTAFGLEADIDSKAFIRKVLEEGTGDRKDLANRLSDKRYLDLASAFRFDQDPPQTQKAGFADTILRRYRDKSFEVAVGDVDDNMRLAMNARSELSAMAGKSQSNDTKWYSILASEPLRTVFQTAFGLPDSFARIDIDKQLETLKARSDKLVGSDDISAYADNNAVEKLIRNFLVRSELSEQTKNYSAGSVALKLLKA